MKRSPVIVAAVALVAAASPLLGVLGGAARAAGNTRLVATTGTDSGNCTVSPCKTVNYALGQAVPYDTVKVAAGTYNQTVDIEKPIQLVGAGAASTILDGQGLDTPVPTYGVVYVGTTGGAVTVSGFTITNPFPYSYTGGEPEIVALADTGSNDAVTITKNNITEGSADANASTDFPIGIDSFKNSAQTVISSNTIQGTFQGALLEDNGPVSFKSNTVQSLISNTDPSTSTVYPPEGAFFLSDLSGSLTAQNATSNTFKSYGGYGLIMEGGYNNGNCSTTPCNGSIAGSFTKNTLALTGATGAVGILFESKFSGNDLTATSSSNKGYVTGPSVAMLVQSKNGATISVTEAANAVVVHPGPFAGAATQAGGLHVRARAH
jgi:hypothetical protein